MTWCKSLKKRNIRTKREAKRANLLLFEIDQNRKKRARKRREKKTRSKKIEEGGKLITKKATAAQKIPDKRKIILCLLLEWPRRF